MYAPARKGKRRPFKQTLFAIWYGGTAAAVVNPQRALEIATTSYYHTTALPSVIRAWWKKDDETITERVLIAESSEAVNDTVIEETVISGLADVEAEAVVVKPEPEIFLEEKPELIEIQVEVTSEETLKEEPVDIAGTEDIAVEITAIEDIAAQPTDSLIVDASESGGAEVVEETSSIEKEVEIEADILAEYVVIESSEPVTGSEEMVEERLPEPTEATVFSETEVVESVVVDEPFVECVAAEPLAAEPLAAEPVAAEPVVAEPLAAEPVVAEPVAAEPVAAEPVAAEPVAAEPVDAEPVVVESVQAEPEIVISVELVDDAIVESVDSLSLPENEIANEEAAVEVSDLPVIVESSELLPGVVVSEELVETSLPEISDATTSTETEITDVVAVQESIILPSEGEITAEVVFEELPTESVCTEFSLPDEAAEIIIEQSNEVESLTSNVKEILETPELKENLDADNNIDCDEKAVIEIIDTS